jgi:hypothetical protein
MSGRRSGRPLVPAYVSTGGRTRPSRNSLERLSVLTGLAICPRDPLAGGEPHGTGSGRLCPSAGCAPSGSAASSRGAAPAAGPPTSCGGAPSCGGGVEPPPLPSRTPKPPEIQRTLPVPSDLPAAQRTLLDTLDGGSLTVVETAALLELPVSAVRVLAAHLIDLGLVGSRPPIPYAAQPDLDLLERVADGLRALKL